MLIIAAAMVPIYPFRTLWDDSCSDPGDRCIPHRVRDGLTTRSRVETSHQRWRQFGGICMPLAISSVVTQGGGDAEANLWGLFLTRIRFIHLRRRRNL